MNLSKKISIFLIILFFVFSRTNTAKALFGSDVFDIGNPLDIGEAVVDIFMEAVSSVGTQAIEQVTERVGNVNNDFLEDTQENITDNIMPGMLEDIDSEIENSPIYQDLLEAFQQDDLDGMPIYFDVNGDGVIDYLDLGLTDTNGDGIVDASDGSSMSPDNPNYQKLLELIYSVVANLIGDELSECYCTI